jgi:hypothetical protein
MTKDEFLAEDMNRVPKRCSITVVSFKLLPWLEGFTGIPKEVVEAASEVLDKAFREDSIRDWRIYPFEEELHVQMNTFGRGIHDQAAQRLALEAAFAGLNRARESRKYKPFRGVDFFTLPLREQIVALNVRPMEFPFTAGRMTGSNPTERDGLGGLHSPSLLKIR